MTDRGGPVTIYIPAPLLKKWLAVKDRPAFIEWALTHYPQVNPSPEADKIGKKLTDTVDDTVDLINDL